MDTSQNKGNPLLINYFCNNDVAIGTGPVGANGKFSRVYVGNFLRANKHVEIGDSVYGISGDNNNIGLLVHTHSGAGVKVRTYNSSLNAFSIQHTGNQSPDNYNGLHTFSIRGDGQTTILTKGYNAALTVRQFSTSSQTPVVFQVMGDGRTYIGQKKAIGSYADAMLHVDGKIACRSLYVLKPISWADEVFEENYKLMDLKELRNYIKKHKHLPEIPSEQEIREKGYDQHEINKILLKKIEELTLYILELEKRSIK